MSAAQRKRALRALFLSLFLHSLFLIPFLKRGRPLPPPLPKAKVETVAFDWIGESAVQSSAASPRKAKRARTAIPKKYAHLDLMPTWHPVYGLAPGTTSNDSSEDIDRRRIQETWTESASYGLGSDDSDMAPYEGRSAFYGEILRRLDNELDFDSLLADYGHFGSVFVYFAVTPDGRLRPETLRAQTLDRVLKVHVARVIRKSLVVPIPEHFWRSDQKFFWVAARFFFLRSNNCGVLAGQRGPWLTLCRAYHGRVPRDDGLAELAQDVHAVRIEPAVSETDPDTLAHPDLRPAGGVGLSFSFGDYLEDRRKTALKKSGFDPFKSWRQDPDWNL